MPEPPDTLTTEGESLVERYRNRELSWLDFNERVLAMAEDRRVPLLERAKFLAIFSQNLDEFFQVRVAGLKDQVAAGVATTSPDGRTAAQQLLDIRDRLDKLLPRMQAVFLDQVSPALAERLQQLDRETLRARLGPYLQGRQIDALLKRRDRLLKEYAAPAAAVAERVAR